MPVWPPRHRVSPSDRFLSNQTCSRARTSTHTHTSKTTFVLTGFLLAVNAKAQTFSASAVGLLCPEDRPGLMHPLAYGRFNLLDVASQPGARAWYCAGEQLTVQYHTSYGPSPHSMPATLPPPAYARMRVHMHGAAMHMIPHVSPPGCLCGTAFIKPRELIQLHEHTIPQRRLRLENERFLSRACGDALSKPRLRSTN
jgi:hypothetical protein